MSLFLNLGICVVGSTLSGFMLTIIVYFSCLRLGKLSVLFARKARPFKDPMFAFFGVKRLLQLNFSFVKSKK